MASRRPIVWPGLEHERFEIRGTLGEGGTGVVYRAFDRARRTEVALKTLRSDGPLDLYRLKQEFRSLADIAHPNLVTLYELHAAADHWFFTMELVDGRPFVHHVLQYDGAPRLRHTLDDDSATASMSFPLVPRGSHGHGAHWARLIDALRQLADAVHALHLSGKLHRDLKPSNVLVDRDGRVVVLDFGLVSDLTDLDDSRDLIVGTPTYMSPEEAGQDKLTAAADWYSVGVMLYQALTGRRPFEGGALEVMAAKRAIDPTPPRTFEPEVPDDLDRICIALLHRDPDQRMDGPELLRALGHAPSAHTRALAGRPPSFVGRADPLDALHQALDESRNRLAAVFVGGAAGMGKSSLLRRFLDQASARDALVLEGRCHPRESVPFKAIDPIVDALAVQVGRLGARLDAALLEELGHLAQLFPVLRRIPGIDAARPGKGRPQDRGEMRRRGFAALTIVLERLSRDSAVVVAIDDLQWGDPDSAAFVSELVSNPEAPPILLVFCHRSEETPSSPLLRSLREASAGAPLFRDLVLAPLGQADALALWTEASRGETPGARARALVDECGGNPLLLTELARHHRPTDHRLSLEAVLQRRVAGLPRDARVLLEITALAARPLPLPLATRAATVESEALAIAPLRAERLVRVRCGRRGEELEPYHERIRDTVVAGLDAPTRQQRHRAIARCLDAEAEPDHEALTEHWREAGELARSGHHAALAAATAEEALAFHQAARSYAIALQHLEVDQATTRALRTRLGHVLIQVGRLDEAAAQFAAAAATAPMGEALELRRLEVEQRLRSGQLETSMSGVAALLREIGSPLPRSRPRLLAAVVGNTVATAILRRWPPRQGRTIAPDMARRIQVLWSLSVGMAFINPVIGRLLHLRLTRAALTTGRKTDLGIATCMNFGYLGSVGLRARREVDARRAEGLALAAELGDPILEGWVHGGSGLASYLFGQWREARERLSTAYRMLHDHGMGVRWLLDIGEIYLTATLWSLGDTAELLRLVPLLVRQAQERGDRLAERGLLSWRSNATWLILDRPDEAEYHVEASVPARQPGEAFQLRHYYELLARAQIDLYRGEGAAAHQLVTSQWRELERSMLLRVQAARIEAWFLRGRCAVAAAQRSSSPRALRAEAERAARVLERERAPWALAFAAALRATVAYQRGQLDAACAGLRAAERDFAVADMALFAAATRVRLGTLVGGDHGGALATDASTAMSRGAVVDPIAMTRMLLPGWE